MHQIQIIKVMRQELLARYYSPQRFAGEKVYTGSNGRQLHDCQGHKHERRIRSVLRGQNDFSALNKEIDRTLRLVSAKRGGSARKECEREEDVERYLGGRSGKEWEGVVKELREQVAYLRERLKENERALSSEISINHKLMNELEYYKDQDAGGVREKLLKVIYGRLDSAEVNYRVVGTEGIDELLEVIESLIEHAAKAKEEVETRFESFVQLHNRQVAVNSRRRLKHAVKGNVDGEITKCESEIKQLNLHEL